MLLRRAGGFAAFSALPRITETTIEATVPQPGQLEGVVGWREENDRVYVERVAGSPAFLDQMHRIRNGRALVDAVHDAWSRPVLPTQLFEWAGALALFVALSVYLSRKPIQGRVFLLMGILYRRCGSLWSVSEEITPLSGGCGPRLRDSL